MAGRNAAVALVLAAALCAVQAAPSGLMTFFDADGCPDGWSELTETKGRLIVSVNDARNAGVTVNKPLSDQEDRIHTHTYSTEANFREKDVAAIGCCNDQGAQHNEYPVAGTSAESNSALPFTQLPLCRLNADTPDPIAFGTIAFFDPVLQACPDGWQPVDGANGRVMIPGYSQNSLVPSSDPPLNSGEDRVHSHYYSTSINATDVSYAGVEGCCNTGPSASGNIPIAGTMSTVSTGIPYIQLLTCVSTDQTFNTSLPDDALVFSDLRCPPGWNVSVGVAGRALVSLPDDGQPGASFGGRSLSPSAQTVPQHTHTFAGSINTQSAGVGLASGCCGSGYAKNQEYEYAGTAQGTSFALPYVLAPMCKRG